MKGLGGTQTMIVSDFGGRVGGPEITQPVLGSKLTAFYLKLSIYWYIFPMHMCWVTINLF